ncbi:UNVERIFIED_ORG: putative membrane protein [Peribacillus simplex]
MGEYTGLYWMMAIIFIVVISNKFLFWWIKAAIVVYYSIISYIFVTTKNKIDRQYENILPVPDAYWDKNSGWVDTMAIYYFWPLVVILLFIYFKWYTSRQSRTAKGWVGVSFIPSIFIFLFFTFMFGFGYGYRP